MANFEIDIKLNNLPFWKGVRAKPGSRERMPYVLGWDDRGFIRQRTPEEVKSQIVEGYATDEYTYITPPPGASAWANRLGDDFLAFIRDAAGSVKDRQILEIGAGSTYIGEKLLADGATGYLIMDPGIKEDSENPKLKIVREYFTSTTRLDRPFDLFVSINCLEHVEEPVKFLRDLNAFIRRSKAKFVLIFPDTEFQFKNGDLNVLLHEHLNCFTMDSAVRVLQDAGYNVLRQESREDCLYFLLEAGPEIAEKAYPMDPNLPDAGLKFQQSIQHVREKIGQAVAKGQKVALHGATNGLNNALVLTGLDGNANIFVFDGDETKAGKFLPACPNPIRHAKDPLYQEMDRVFISALTFYPEIERFLIQEVKIKPEEIFPIFPAVELGRKK